MLRQLFVFVFALFALNATANTIPEVDTLDNYITLEIEKAELENELFGTLANGEEISIASVEVYKLEEEITIGFDTKAYLPENFDARTGMGYIDWNTIELFEVEEELDLGFDTKDYLPKNFNPYRGLDCEASVVISFNY
ncbi:MAG: hypothetical protein HKN00_04755 [Flavobacteriaceae bacterium]|nr:hypothetical protein [Bacteroidia bacterium]MBT8288626.1 hypothetical protein [Bacteroidia bacterium]NNF74472.1 hypothetical protein [Flavobacteriaceae bacterium]NNK74343.1 hypothetical protein [Flavobacteriaceae bacterium]